MNAIVTARSAHDFLAVVPQLVGMRPTESLVLVLFRGSRTCGAMRFDLPPDPADHEMQNAVASRAIGLACRVDGVSAVVPIVYTGVKRASTDSPPCADLVAGVTAAAVSAGFALHDALWVAADSWGHFTDGAPMPLALIADSEALDAVPPHDRRELADLDAHTSLPHVDDDARRLAWNALQELERARSDAAALAAEFSRLGFGTDVVRGIDRAIEPASDPAANAALLTFLLGSPLMRDIALVTWLWGRGSGGVRAEQVLLLVDDADERADSVIDLPPPILAAIGASGSPWPSSPRIRAAIDAVKTAAALIPADSRQPLFVVLGWLHWCLGQGSVAGAWLDLALAMRPDDDDALVLEGLLRAGELPEWVFSCR